MSFHDLPVGGVIGRTPAQIRALGDSLLASLNATSDVEALSAQLGRASTSDAANPPRFDLAEEIPLAAVGLEAETKLRPHVWSRLSERLSESRLFAPQSETSRLLATRFAEAIHRYNLKAGDVLKPLFAAVEELEQDRELKSLWKLLSCIAPGEDAYARPLMGPIQGAQRYFEESFQEHVRRTVRLAGHPALPLIDCIRIFVQNTLTQNSEAYPAWPLIYVSIRCGDYKAAAEFASKAKWPGEVHCDAPYYYLRTVMQNPSYVACRRFPDLETACSTFMKKGARKKLDASYRYMLMSIAFLCGQINVADSLVSESAQTWDSLDEFLWFALGCLRSGNGVAGQFDYKRLHSRLAAYQEDYYTASGQHPTRYALVLFSALQFGSALYYLLSQTVKPSCAMHVVHMAIVLQHCGLLERQDSGDAKQMKASDLAELVLEYGRSLAESHSQMAWHYYMLSHALSHDYEDPTAETVAYYFVDLLQRSGDVHLANEESSLWKDLGLGIDRSIVIKMTSNQLIFNRQYELAILLHRAVQQYDAALYVCHQMWAQVLVDYSHQSESVQAANRQDLKIHISQIWDYITDVLQCPSNESEQLKKISEVFVAASPEECNRMSNLILNFELLPHESDDVRKTVINLTNSFPSVIPLVAPLLSILCRHVERVDWNETQPLDKNQLMHRISALKAFLMEMPPPHADYAVYKELEVAESGLRTESKTV